VRRATVAVGALAALAVVVTVVGRVSDRSGATDTEQASATQPNTVEATATAPPRAASDPVAAAVKAVGLTGEVVRAGFISRRELIESFTTARFGPRLADETSEQVSSLLLALGASGINSSELSVVEVPITARVIGRSAASARVEVWSVMAVAVAAAGPGRQAWRTVALDLVLVDDLWLVDGWSSRPGPTPAFAPEVPIASGGDVAEVIDWGPALTGDR
jgi:hypothetical protein